MKGEYIFVLVDPKGSFNSDVKGWDHIEYRPRPPWQGWFFLVGVTHNNAEGRDKVWTGQATQTYKKSDVQMKRPHLKPNIKIKICFCFLR